MIESVIFAHDAERKWIQNHPVILYDSYLLSQFMKDLKNRFLVQGVELFSKEALSAEGIKLPETVVDRSLPGRIRLLSDDDIIFMMKNMSQGNYADEYFGRNCRMHPVWKSEAEYNTIVGGSVGKNSQAIKDLMSALSDTVKFIDGNDKYRTIKKELLDDVKNEIEKLKKNQKMMDKESYRKNLNEKNRIFKVLSVICREATRYDTEFLLLSASTFNSGFAKADFSDIIVLPADNMVVKYTDAINSMEAKRSQQDSFFYLFYKRILDSKGNLIRFDSATLIKKLVTKFIK